MTKYESISERRGEGGKGKRAKDALLKEDWVGREVGTNESLRRKWKTSHEYIGEWKRKTRHE